MNKYPRSEEECVRADELMFLGVFIFLFAVPLLCGGG